MIFLHYGWKFGLNVVGPRGWVEGLGEGTMSLDFVNNFSQNSDVRVMLFS